MKLDEIFYEAEETGSMILLILAALMSFLRRNSDLIGHDSCLC